jgi:hypothetical protein
MASLYDYIVAPFTIINIIIGVPLIFISLIGINMVKEYNLQRESNNLLKKSE